MPDYPLSNNNRVYYAIHAVAMAEMGVHPGVFTADNAFKIASGVQSVGINTNFNLEQVYQLGQLEIYENIEDIPDVEVTMEKVLDGHPLLQHLATPQATALTLASRYNNNRTDVRIAYFSDVFENASGTPQAELYCSGMYVSSISFNLPVEGNCTESISLVGNDKTWTTGSAMQAGDTSAAWWYGGGSPSQSAFGSAGTPAFAGGVLRRQDVLHSGCIWPLSLPGTKAIAGATGATFNASTYFMPKKADGTTSLYTTSKTAKGASAASGSDGVFPIHIQNVTVSTDLGRTELFELGRRGPYHRFADFPTEVTCSIEIIETEIGDMTNAVAESESNVDESPIFIMLADGTLIDLGEKNKLASISSTGGDTGGGNRTASFNYSNFNALSVSHPNDPADIFGAGKAYGKF